MSRRTLSPVEEEVLALISGRWWTAEELELFLYPAECPQTVEAALEYLTRERLVFELETRFGQPMYELTPLGLQVLCRQRRERIARFQSRLRRAHAA